MDIKLDNCYDCSRFKQHTEIIRPLELQPSKLEMIIKTFDREINFGLSSDENERMRTTLPMIKTHFTEIPAVSESGVYLSVDLGGTNFRIIMAVFDGTVQEFVSEVETIPKEFHHSSCRKLYDYMAEKLAVFLESRGLVKESFKMGYTFSFPAVSENMRSAKLLTWTNDFACSDGEGEDCGKLFQEAISRRGDLSVEIVCVANDTTATLLAGAYRDRDCLIGVVLGTGSNAAYFLDDGNQKMIYNIEWGALGDNGCFDFVRTSFDDTVDKNSLHPGSFTFDKMVGGLYFGELFRVVLEHLAEAGLFLQLAENGKQLIPRPWALKTIDVSSIYYDPDHGTFSNTTAMLNKMGLLKFCSPDDIILVRHVGKVLRQRTADIVASACATLVRHAGRPDVTIAFDGSFYKKLPGLSELIESRLNILCPVIKIRMMLVDDGSGRGGALAAAVAEHKLKQEVSDTVNEIVSLAHQNSD